MIEMPAAAVALAATSGLLLGLLYFATLWWTVRRIQSSRHPGLLVAGSFLFRAVLAAAGIVLASDGRPLPLLFAVAGFLVGRTLMIRLVGAPLAGAGVSARAGAPAQTLAESPASRSPGPDSR